LLSTPVRRWANMAAAIEAKEQQVKVLVTGGAGYIGSHAVQTLAKSGHIPVVLDTLEYGTRAAVGDATLIVGNMGDRELVERVLRDEQIDAVMHFAAYKAPGESMEQPGRYFQNNVCGTLGLLEAMQTTGVKRLVFSSTCAVYGTPTELPVSERNTINPESPYGESKALAERLLKWFDTCHNLRYVSLRYFNAGGAAFDGSIGEDWSLTLNLVPLVMKAALGRVPTVRVFGTDYPTPDGTAIRDYIHVVDLVEAHVKALEFLQREDRSEIFNLGTGKGSSVKEVVDEAKKVSGIDFPVEYTGRRPGDPVAIWADNSKARQLLDWEPKYGLHEIVQTAWAWHSSHPDGYKTEK
jgi:UDP-glucose 4-epimerase